MCSKKKLHELLRVIKKLKTFFRNYDDWKHMFLVTERAEKSEQKKQVRVCVEVESRKEL